MTSVNRFLAYQQPYSPTAFIKTQPINAKDMTIWFHLTKSFEVFTGLTKNVLNLTTH